MSDIKWCDTGEHGFPWGKDPDEREFAETRERNGRRPLFHTCGPCYRKSTAKISAAALASGTVVDNNEE